MTRGLSDREQRVCSAIARREQAVIDDLALHVALPTGGGNRAAIDESRERLTSRTRALGATVDLRPGQSPPSWLHGAAHPHLPPLPVAVCRRDRGLGPAVLLAGHLDTVHDPLGPFQRLVIDGSRSRATGPGCVDMKGGLVIALAALEALEECGVALDWTMLLNADEETGSFQSSAVILHESQAVAQRPMGGVGIALEPASSDGGLVTQRSGSGQFVLVFTGIAAHVGRDFSRGVSAVNRLAEAVLRCAELSRPEDGAIVNIGPIQGGHATNVVPDHAQAWGNVRFSTTQQCQALCASLDLIARSVGGTCHVAVGRPAKPCTPDVERFALSVRTVSEALGLPLPFASTGGVCDGNLMQAAGLVTLDTLGVRGGGLHTTGEWIELDTLVRRCQLLAVSMMRAATGQA